QERAVRASLSLRAWVCFIPNEPLRAVEGRDVLPADALPVQLVAIGADGELLLADLHQVLNRLWVGVGCVRGRAAPIAHAAHVAAVEHVATEVGGVGANVETAP